MILALTGQFKQLSHEPEKDGLTDTEHFENLARLPDMETT